MDSCRNFEELVQTCLSARSSIPDLDFINFTNVHLASDAEDLIASSLLPEDCRVQNPFTIKTSVDGACFAHAASWLVFGTEELDIEIRCCIMIKGVLN